MFVTGCQITVGEYEFKSSVTIEIDSNIETFTDTCKITLPRKYEWDLRRIALGDDPILQRKNPVVVKLGYNGLLATEFVGYIRDIRPGTPVTLECEDSMMLLKEGNLKATLPNTTLRKLLEYILPKGTSFQCLDNVTIGDWLMNDITPLRVLEELKSKFGFFSQFRLLDEKPVLHVGWPYWLSGRKVEEYAFGQRWRDGRGLIINSDDLLYKRAEDVRIKVKAVSVGRDNQRKEYEFGDPDGELRTFHYYNADRAMLEERARRDLEHMKYTGYRGSFLTFGEPALTKGDVAVITGNEYHPDGKYLVKQVVKRFGVGIGYKQTIYPHRLINEVTEV